VEWTDIASAIKKSGQKSNTVAYSKKRPVTGTAITNLGKLLHKAGYLSSSDVTYKYNLDYEEAVKAFQKKQKLTVTGKVDKKTYTKLDEACKKKDKNKKDAENTSSKKTKKPAIEPKLYDGTPKHTPFFQSGNSSPLRKDNIEIKINFGVNDSKNNTIKHVFLRSLGVTVDASGTPIYKTYEFIGQDVQESDVTDTINQLSTKKKTAKSK
jgi:peptidoglycan hydrolase-like protein with peptidoglycan-binding domain